jgi:hypothetical protein
MNTFKNKPNIQQEALKKAVLSPFIGKHGKRKKTLVKEEALKQIAQRSIDASMKITESILVKAIGSYYVYKNIDGHISRVIDPYEIEEALNKSFIDEEQEDNYYIVTIKDPDVKAGEILLNRAFGKPKEEPLEEYKVEINEESREKYNKAFEAMFENKKICSICKLKRD